jgi:hypothetical protein
VKDPLTARAATACGSRRRNSPGVKGDARQTRRAPGKPSGQVNQVTDRTTERGDVGAANNDTPILA